jgi:hypothetical protein
MSERMIDDVVRAFSKVIAAAWQHALPVATASSNPNFINDWLQANWEMLVEGVLPRGTYLEVYGEGADVNSGSSRVSAPDAHATAAIVVRAPAGLQSVCERLTGEGVVIPSEGFAVEEMVTLDGSWYARRAPFDCVLVETASVPLVFSLHDVVFGLGAALRG